MPRHRTYVEGACAHCGRLYRARADTRQRYCSTACAQSSQRHPDVPCRRCGASVRATRSLQAAGKGKYCGRTCYLGDPEQRFWGYVDKVTAAPCWRWTGPSIQGGYGRFSFDGTATLAHRASWTINRGPIPPGQVVRHRCPGGGNPWCVNPDHLAVGTHADNAQDVFRDGRHWSQTGEWHPKQRVRPASVVGEMRELVVILPRTLYRRLAGRAKTQGQSLQDLGLAALIAADHAE
jgi:hypothetical protein